MNTLTFLDLLALVALFGCVGLALNVLLLNRRIVALEKLLGQQAARVGVLDQDFGALLSCTRTIGDRIGKAERYERALQQQLDKLALNRDDGQVAIEHAMKLVASGQALEEVIRICELSEGEVEILQNLARFRPAA